MDVIAAAVIGLLLFVPALYLLNQAVHTIETANEIRMTAMLGRMYMEKQRSYHSGQATLHDKVEWQQQWYEINGRQRLLDSQFVCHEIEVLSPHDKKFVCTCLEPLSP